ncbi:Similar to commd3: COMM domain-containing protein 3 (Dictyostelium discoideum) [Cotesia congregata]|uniref:COMM domain-containing protein 3 n=1 Tax=Cotesia congregata TaxID=51543 RepID=A0A8J2MLK4_COTCN|nr:Similar to commd3: COMM domain-containing protein 3 (Dictyostelium discoideum) [Cotesia congregata]
MELPDTLKNNLRIIKTSLSDELFDKLLSDCNNMLMNVIIDNPKDKMTIYSDYISIIKEAARNNYDPENLSDYLQTTGIFNDTQIQKLCQVYYKQIKTPMVLHLSSIGDSHPCIVDISWRLDYCLKTSNNSYMNNCIYHIKLTTKRGGTISDVDFTCTIEGLHELVYKIKDIVRHMEKLVQRNCGDKALK